MDERQKYDENAFARLQPGQDAAWERFALESAGAGVWNMDPLLRTYQWNDRCKELYGFPKERPVVYEELFANVHPADLDRVSQSAAAALAAPQSNHWEIRFRTVSTEDGQLRWLHLKGKACFDLQGNACRVSGTVVELAAGKSEADVKAETAAQAALVESEKGFRKLVQEAPVATAIYTGNDTTIQLANEKMIELWGKDASVIGKPLAEALPELKGQPFARLLQTVYSTGIAYQADEEPADLVIGGKLQTLYFNFTYKPLKDENGEVYAILHMAVDVTAKKRIEQQLEQIVLLRTEELRSSNIDLQRSNQELEQFAYIASHDMQEPVRKIFTFSQMLLGSTDERLNEKDKTYINKIHDASGRALTIIRDLLDLSYLNDPERKFIRTDLNEITKNVLVDLELLMLQRKAIVKHDNLPLIHAIPLQMNQLFYNLVNNFLKFSKPGFIPELFISSSILTAEQVDRYPALDRELSYFELVFSDNGIGFDQKYASKIFTVFQRLHSRQSFTGTGIGLALCKKVVENHCGEIFAVSEDGRGAAFHVILPVKQKTPVSDNDRQ